MEGYSGQVAPLVSTSPARAAHPQSTGETAGEAAESTGRRPARWHSPRWALHPVGFALGVILGELAMTPSLIPRTWLYQGVISGITAALGYGIGVAATAVLRHSLRYQRIATLTAQRVTPPRGRQVWTVLVAVAAVSLLAMLVAGAHWQRELATVMGTEPPSTFGWMRAGPIAIGVFAVPLLLVRGLRGLDHLLAGLLRRYAHVPRRVAGGLAAVLLAVVLASLADQVVWNQSLSVLDRIFAGQNQQTAAGVVQPVDPERSGSPASLAPWSTLGYEGRTFVAGGRGPADLAAASGHAPVAPIRVYAGLESAPDAQGRADLAVRELARTGAFTRPVIVVATTTGKGWVDPGAVDSLEAAYGGNTAVVASQYSFLPSPLSFLLDGDRAGRSGQTMFDTVSRAVAALPPGTPHPKVLVFGESLGSQGSEAAFDSLGDLRARADGALWNGPPHSNRLWSSVVDRRDPGTTEVHPQYADGMVVRFGGGAATPTLTTTPPRPWLAPRVVYLQHPSDPVVWWSPKLAWSRPDWLGERHGDDVLSAMHWYPVVTFWQVTADMANAQSVPFGHGHNYGTESLDAWMDIAPPAGWTPADTARTHAVLDGR